VLGRGFCGWICPGAGCQEALFSARDKKVRKGDFIKWLIWIPWMATIVILVIRRGGYSQFDFFYRTTHGFSIGDLSGLIAYLMVLLLLIVLPALIFGRRSFCHHLCWMAPFMILGRKIRNYFKWPSLQLRAESDQCQHCHICTDNCPMSLPVESMVQLQEMEKAECILCGTCVDGCPAEVIRYSFRNGK
jgi:polyferredoxin